MEEARDSGTYLGCFVAEGVLSKYFKNVVRMPMNNPGFDFICQNGFKIDVKSACLFKGTHKNCSWTFIVNKNVVADYFLMLGFDDRKSLNPLRLWLVPGMDVNMMASVNITNSERGLSKWEKYERPLGGVISECESFRAVNVKC
jgi:hypothetical protein